MYRQAVELLYNLRYIQGIMNKTITIKTDAATKEAAEAFAKEMGLTLSGLINGYLKQVTTRHLEFDVPEEPMTPKLESLLEEAETSIERGKVSPPRSNVADFIRDLKEYDD